MNGDLTVARQRVLGDALLQTHSQRPAEGIAEELDKILSLPHTREGATKAQQRLSSLIERFPYDSRLSRLLQTFQIALVDDSPKAFIDSFGHVAVANDEIKEAKAKGARDIESTDDSFQKSDQRKADLSGTKNTTPLTGDAAKISVTQVAEAFRNLAQGAEPLMNAATNPDPEVRLSRTNEAHITHFDRRMTTGTIRLAMNSMLDGNAPAATILTVGNKVVSIGVNQSYYPVREYIKHGEQQALEALQERIYTGVAQILLMHRERGGALSPDTHRVLNRLEELGIRKTTTIKLNPEELERDGFFSAEKIKEYSERIRARAQDAFAVDMFQNEIHSEHRDTFDVAMKQGIVEPEDLADWTTFDRILNEDRNIKLDLYSSLEPCEMCMQLAISYGKIGRVVFAASDDKASGLNSINHKGEHYFDRNQVPFEIVGGIQGETAHTLFDTFSEKIYEYAKAGKKPPINVLREIHELVHDTQNLLDAVSLPPKDSAA